MNYYKLTYRFPSYPSDGQGISFKFARTEAEAKERAQKALRVKAEFLKVELEEKIKPQCFPLSKNLVGKIKVELA